MKIKQALGAVLSAAVLAVSALGAALPAAAAQSTAVGLTVRKWNGTTNTEIGSGESLAAGDIVTVSIKLDKPVSNIGGIDFTLGYDIGCFQYQDGSASCLIVDSNGRGDYKAAAGSVRGIWDTTTTNLQASGSIFSFRFTVQNVEDTKSAAFTLKINSFFDSTINQEDYVLDSDTATASVQVGSTTVDSAVIAAIEKIVTITATTTLADIQAAEAAYAGLNNAEKAKFNKEYPELYQALNTARQRYNDFQASLSQQQQKELAEKFLRDYAHVFSLTTSTVTIDDKDAVYAAVDAYLALSSGVRQYIAKDKQQLLSDLRDKMDVLVDKADEEAEEAANAEKEAKEFRENLRYSVLWDVEDSLFDEQYETLGPLVDEALAVYGMKSSAVKALLQDEYTVLTRLQERYSALVENNAEEKALREKVNAYQSKWIYVLALTEETVTIGDETAINMALNDYKSLDPEVQERLAARKAGLEKLLLVIQGLKETQDSTTDPQPTDPPTTPTSPVINGGDNGTPQDPEVVTVEKNVYLDRGVSSVIMWLFILLGVSVLLLSIPLALYLQNKKREKDGLTAV